MNCGTRLPMACANCSTELPAGAKFCFNCGHKVGEPAVEAVRLSPRYGSSQESAHTMIDPQTYDWTTFQIVFFYSQRVEDVFRYWVSPSGLEAFFIEKAYFVSTAGRNRLPDESVQNGDTYHWEWRQPFEVEGEVLDCRTDEEFSFTFGSMKVSVYFATEGKQTKLRLVQSDIPETDDGRVYGHLNCRSCWVFFLTNLKSVLETGRDLRDESPERASSMEVGYQLR